EPLRSREFWNHTWKPLRMCSSKRLEVWQHARKLSGRVCQSKKLYQQRLQGLHRQFTAVSLLHNIASDKKKDKLFPRECRKQKLDFGGACRFKGGKGSGWGGGE